MSVEVLFVQWLMMFMFPLAGLIWAAMLMVSHKNQLSCVQVGEVIIDCAADSTSIGEIGCQCSTELPES